MEENMKRLEESMYEISMYSNRALESIRVVCDVMRERQVQPSDYDFTEILRVE